MSTETAARGDSSAARATDSRPPLSPPAGRPGLQYGFGVGGVQIASFEGLRALDWERDTVARVIANCVARGEAVHWSLIEDYLDLEDRIDGIHLTYRELSAA